MNSRERILAAARRQRADHPATSLRCTAEAWTALQQHLGVGSNNEVLDALDIDLRWLPLPFIGPASRSAVPLGSEGTDYWGCHIQKIQTSFNYYFEFDYHPLAQAQSVEDVENYDWPSLDWWDYKAVPDLIQRINVEQPRAILMFSGGSFETPWYMRGLEQFLMDLYEAPEIAVAISRKVTDYFQQRTLRVLEAAKGQIDVIGSGGDIGEQRGMLVDPELWRRLIKPQAQRLSRHFKDKGLATFYHSCGSIIPVIPDLIAMGVDILDPIQVSAAGMTPQELYPAFGQSICFHGAIDEVNLLPHGTPDQVYQETLKTIDVLGQSGGYIVSPSHQVQGDTAPENVAALFRAAHDYRWR